MTIVCTKCGFRNGGQDDFCGSCGEFLEFVGERIDEPGAPPGAEPVPEPAGAAAAAAPDAEHDVVIPEPELVSAETGPPAAQAASPVTDAPPPSTETAPSITETPPSTEPPQPAAIAPQQLPTRRRATEAPAPTVVHPGDLLCGECGQGNDPQRRFCRSCGASLHDAAVSPPERRRWWQRLRRRPKVHHAGDRPMRRDRPLFAPIAKAVLGLAVVAALIGLAGPWRSAMTSAFHSARTKVAPHYEPVNPVKAEASSALPDHGPELAIDTGSNTWWAEAAKGDGEGQTISVLFAQPVDLAKVGFTIGAPGDQFLAQPRPQKVHLTLRGTDPARAPATHDLTLHDHASFQVFTVRADGITRIDIEIRSVFGGQQGSDCGITDLQFFRRS